MASSIEDELRALNQPVKRRLDHLFGKRRKPWEVYGLLSEFLLVEGKMLRPALCLASCRAAGGDARRAVSAAAAIEMFHNFTLIHDDIEDASEMRRGKPCMHVKYGLPLALNAGDGLFMMVWKETLGLSGPRGEEARRRLLSSFTQVLEGQAIELGWYRTGKWDVGEADYFRVIRGKTGALISTSCEVGALLGGADDRTCGALARFGMGIGVGFQIIDDVLNITGDEKMYGKEIGGDIREGKRTLMTIRAQRMLWGEKRVRLARLLRKSDKTKKDVAAAADLLRESGAVEATAKTAERMVRSAIAELRALPASRARQTMRRLAEYVIQRER